MAAPPNAQTTVDWATMTIARGLYNKIRIAKNFNTQYQKDYEQDFPVGATIKPRLPWRFKKSEQVAYAPQGLVDRTTTITMDQWFQYSVEWDSTEKALTLPRENLKQQYLDPIIEQAAQDVDSAAALFAQLHTNNVVGNLGGAIASLGTLRDASTLLVNKAGWTSKMTGVLTPGMANQVVGLGQTLFNKSGTIDRQFSEGEVGEYANVDWVQSVSPYTVTAGTAVTAITVTGANQQGTSLIITGTITQTLKDGDKIAIGSGTTGMYSVNPATRRTTNTLQALTVVGDYTLTGGADTITVSPAIIGPGSQYQNVDALPQDGASVVLWPGTTSPSGKIGPCGVLFSDQAFAIVGAKLEEPMSAELHSVQSIPNTPIKVRFVRSWDVFESRMINRVDLLMGFGELQPDNCSVLIAGNI